MNKYETNKMNSFLSSDEVLLRNEPIWKADEVIKKDYDRIKILLPQVSKHHQNQVKNGTSGTIAKSGYKTGLINLCVKISESSVSYAAGKNDAVLEAAVKLGKSKLNKLPQVTLYDVLSGFYKKVLPLKDSLKHLEKDDLDKMGQLLKDFKASIPLTQANMDETKTATLNISETIKTINEIFLKLDKHIAPYKYSYPDFYNDYFNSRKVIDLKGKGSKAKAQSAT